MPSDANKKKKTKHIAWALCGVAALLLPLTAFFVYLRPMMMVSSAGFDSRNIVYHDAPWQRLLPAALMHRLPLWTHAFPDSEYIAIRPSAPPPAAGYAGLRKLSELEKLHITHPSFTDSDMAYIAGLNQLDYLAIGSRTSKNSMDSGMAHLSGLPRLERLNLAGEGFTDSCLPDIDRISRLTYLKLIGTRVTEEGIRRDLLAKRPHLEVWWEPIGSTSRAQRVLP